VSLNPDTECQVTFDKDEAIRNGDPYVHRAEFGINKGIFWSPGGNRVAFYRKDERNVTEYPLVDVNSRPASFRFTRYPMTGMASEHVTIGVYDIKTGSITFLQTGEPRDHYLTSVTWSPDGRWIYVVHLNRDQNHLRLVQYHPETGVPVHTLFEEKHEKWVEPLGGPFFAEKRPGRFLWYSKRDGYNHLYLYEVKRKKLRQLTRGTWDITRFAGFDKTGEIAFFEAASGDGMERHGYQLRITSGKWSRLTSRSGVHRITPSDDGSYVLDSFSNFKVPRIIQILDDKGNHMQTLLKAPDPISDYAQGEIRLFAIKNKEDISLNVRMIMPPEFDPSIKYPVLIYVYGGPHGQMITNSWGSSRRLWFLYMAQQGYIVFTLDNRGTDARGLEFEHAVFRRLGTLEVEDQMTGVDYIKNQAYVDTTRLGVFGWSYGGFMTLSLMSRNPGIFSTGVAGGPVTDWQYYEVMYGERYMDTPMANPDGYKESSTLNYVNQLEGNLLIIHGTVDPVVVWQNSLVYLKKAVEEGKHVDYFVYPGHEHNIYGRDRLHLYQTVTDYFMDNL